MSSFAFGRSHFLRMFGKPNAVNSMSMRQQILYIMQMSSQQTEWDNKGKCSASRSQRLLTNNLHVDDAVHINPNQRFDELKFSQVSRQA